MQVLCLQRDVNNGTAVVPLQLQSTQHAQLRGDAMSMLQYETFQSRHYNTIGGRTCGG
jgi:hypothetical protein